MNKKERISAAFAGKEVDYVPSAFWFHFPDDRFYGDKAVEAHLDFYRKTDVDLLKVMNEHQYQFDIPIKTPSDWKKLKPFPIKNSFYQDQLYIIKKISDCLGGEVPLLATIHGVFASAFHGSKLPGETIAGKNYVTNHLKEDPEAVSQGLATVADSLAELSLACLEAGADGIYYAALGGEECRFSEETFLKYIKPYDLQILKTVQERCQFLVLHICKERIRLPLYADYPADAVNWAVHDCGYTLKDGRDIFKRTILGGLDDRSGVMLYGSKKEIKQEALNLIETFGKKGFILGSDCTLPTNIPIGNICAAIGAARSL